MHVTPAWQVYESAKVTIYWFPYSSLELPIFADLPDLKGTEVLKIVLKFTLPSGQLFQPLANQLATTAFPSGQVTHDSHQWRTEDKPHHLGVTEGKKVTRWLHLTLLAIYWYSDIHFEEWDTSIL